MWILKMTGALTLGVGVLACVQPQDKEHKPVTNHTETSSTPDSTAFYDSLYAPVQLEITEFFDSLNGLRQFNGIYIVSRKGRIFARGKYGIANHRAQTEITDSTVFQIASMSKPMTAICIMKLVALGKLTLEDDIKKFFPEFPYSGVKIKHLLAHRGGLGNYMYFTESEWKKKGVVMRNSDVMAFMALHNPKIFFPPDTKFDYSNTGYAVLASVVEKVSGKPFRDFLAETVFKPANMTSAFLVEPDNILHHAAAGYESNGLEAPNNSYLNGVYGDKGVYCNVEDLHQFMLSFRNSAFLPDSLTKILKTPANPIESDSTTYGYGFRLVYPDTDSLIVHHTGWFQGFRGNMLYCPEKDIIIVWITNKIQGPFFSPKLMRKVVLKALRRMNY